MKIFKSISIAISSFILWVLLITNVIIAPFIYFNPNNSMEVAYRSELAGTIDLLISGASHGSSGIVPKILDEKLGCNSYNISDNAITLLSRYKLLECELKRNHIKNVIIDVSFDALSRDVKSEGSYNDMNTIYHLDSVSSKFSFLFTLAKEHSVPDVVSQTLRYGVRSWIKMSFGIGKGEKRKENKGFLPNASSDLSLNKEDEKNIYNTLTYPEQAKEFNYNLLTTTVELCQQYGAKPTFVIIPVSRMMNLSVKNLDNIYSPYYQIAKKYGINIYDFNLLKGKDTILPDNDSYFDATHLSALGAEKFSKLLADFLIENYDSDLIKDKFYNSYVEYKNINF